MTSCSWTRRLNKHGTQSLNCLVPNNNRTHRRGVCPKKKRRRKKYGFVVENCHSQTTILLLSCTYKLWYSVAEIFLLTTIPLDLMFRWILLYIYIYNSRGGVTYSKEYSPPIYRKRKRDALDSRLTSSRLRLFSVCLTWNDCIGLWKPVCAMHCIYSMVPPLFTWCLPPGIVTRDD